MMKFDINFDFHTDAKGGDPDKTSPTLRRYHKILWSKILPNGKELDLVNNKNGSYLYHASGIGEFYFGSDSIINSYKHHQSKKWLTEQVVEQVEELYKAGSMIGAYIIFPNKKINGGYTINQARGIERLIDDRFDLTLECIRLFYSNQNSPLFKTFLRYQSFFDLFKNFRNYVDYFLLQDLIDDNEDVKFFLPFDGFQTYPKILTKEHYTEYKEKSLSFVVARNSRIENYIREKINKTENFK